jgi:hypothetical protein
MTTGQFEINTPTVVSDIIDGEAVMINLDSGAYYSMNGTGSRIWDRIRERGSLETLIGELAAGRQAEAAQIDAAVRVFIGQLRAENLIRPRAERPGAETAPETRPAGAAPEAAGAPFEAPLLEKYRDLEDLLLADPIHDVSEAGWPHQNPR